MSSQALTSGNSAVLINVVNEHVSAEYRVNLKRMQQKPVIQPLLSRKKREVRYTVRNGPEL